MPSRTTYVEAAPLDCTSVMDFEMVDAMEAGTAVAVKEWDEFPGRPAIRARLESLHDCERGLGAARVVVCDDATVDHGPASVVCVIDVSYSMDDPATMHNDSEGSAGLSLLDIVKHATSTVVETLGDGDELAVVAYASSARVVLPFTEMTAEGRSRAKKAVSALATCGNTNIWDGLAKAMDLVRKQQQQAGPARIANVLLLTDGLPNVHPPRGELATLVRYREAHPDLQCAISTFGFGYNLDSRLLSDIAVVGEGHYAFIPDSSFVGTVFINAASNLLSTAISTCRLSIEAQPGVTIGECLSLQQGGDATATSWGMSISLPGGIRYGQTYDVLFRIVDERREGDRDVPPFSSTLAFQNHKIYGSSVARRTAQDDAQIEASFQRSQVIRLILSTCTKAKAFALGEAAKNVEALQDEFKRRSSLALNNRRSHALRKDLDGQITEACSRQDWYDKWGRHYLLSLARAHELQQCTNFKDPGVQVYATKKFALIRDRAEDLFCNLPPPKPSLIRDDNHARRVGRPQMSSYHNAGAPCFAEGDVLMADGRLVSVKDVVAGDLVATRNAEDGSPRSARVLCVVATECEAGLASLVELDGGVLVTPYHPVRALGLLPWSFPCQLAPASLLPCDRVYSFVLADDGGEGVMRIGPHEAVTLGHGIRDDPIASHGYLGTERVVEDLSAMVGWGEGRIELGPNPAVRDAETGLVVSFRPPPAAAAPQQPLESDHAINYVTTIQKRFANEPETYKKFLEILRTYEKEQRGIKEALEEVSALFSDHPDLLKEFTYFLPDTLRAEAKAQLETVAMEAE